MDTIVSRFGLLLYLIAGVSVGVFLYSAVVTMQRAQWYVPAPVVCGTAYSACV